MKKLLIIAAIALAIAGCKKKQETPAQFCSCVNNTNDNVLSAIEDSSLFYPMLLGTWYLKQFNNLHSSTPGPQCYCDTQYSITFLANKTLILNLPGYLHDTVAYRFPSDTGNLIFTGSGTFNNPGDTSQPGQIYYNNNYLALTTEFSGYGSLIAPPTFYLTRH